MVNLENSRTSTIFVPGELLCNRFRITRFIARGGMGEVYAAMDAELGLEVALKTVRADVAGDPSALKRFKRELKLARHVTHPNVCRVYDLFRHADGDGNEVTFLTMELLEGESLAARIRRDGPLPLDCALEVLTQVVAALSTAHAAGVVHRDLKCENVLLVGGAGSVRAVVTDFGLAASPVRNEALGDSTATVGRDLVGTPAYMSPEQLEGAPGTPASDIYALGVVLFEMVTGDRPFDGPNPMSAAVRRLVEKAPSPRKLVPDLDRRWERAILGCLEREPARRFTSAADVLDAVHGRAPAPRRKWLAAAVAVTALLLAAGVWFGTALRGGVGTRPSVAVLGFRNLTQAPDAGWLDAALSEMIATELASSESLRLVPGEEVDRLRVELELPDVDSFSEDTLRLLRQRTGTDYVVSGSYVQLEEQQDLRLRVDLRVQKTTDGAVITSISSTGGGEDLFAMVSDTGRRVLEDLGAGTTWVSGAGANSGLPTDPQALRSYAQGLERLRRFDAVGARDRLEEAATLQADAPLTHAALAETFRRLGYGPEARTAAERALELAGDLRRESRLLIEARADENYGRWEHAAEIYRSLWTFYPDVLQYGIALAEAQIAAGVAEAALLTVSELRRSDAALFPPRLDLLEAEALAVLSRREEQRDAARAAARGARRAGARLLLARARLIEGRAQWALGGSAAAEVALGDARRIFVEVGDRRAQAETLVALAIVRRDEDDLVGGERLFNEALEVSREIGDAAGVAAALHHLAGIHRLSGDLERASKEYDAALEVCRQTGDRRREGRILRQAAMVRRVQGDLYGARNLYRQAYRVLFDCGDRSAASGALTSIAVVQRQLGELDGAVETLEEVLRIKREIGDRRSQAVPLINLANVNLDRGDLAAAEHHYRAALEIARELESGRHAGYALFGLGEVAFARDELDEALSLHEAALEVRRQIDDAVAVAASGLALSLVEVEVGRSGDALQRVRGLTDGLVSSGGEIEVWAAAVQAIVALEAGANELAEQSAARALELSREVSDRGALAMIFLAAGRTDVASGRLERAAIRLEEALEAATEAGLRSQQIEISIVLAEVEQALGNDGAMRFRLEGALRSAERLGLHRDARRVREVLARVSGQPS